MLAVVFLCVFSSTSSDSGEVDSKELYKVVAGILPGDFEVRVHTSQVSIVVFCVVFFFSFFFFKFVFVRLFRLNDL